MNINIKDYFERQARLLHDEFNEARKKGKGTPQEIADFKEGYFREFLKRLFPKRITITKGQIIDSFGNKSNSIDCLVLSPIHPNLVDSSDKFNFIMVDGVDYAIEVKSDFTDKSEFLTGVKQLQSVNRLRRKSSELIGRKNTEDMKELSRQPYSILFFNSDKKISDNMIINRYNQMQTYYKENNVDNVNQLDMIVINNCGIVINYKSFDGCINVPTVDNGDYVKSIFLEYKELTLLYMLAFSEIYRFPSSTRINSAEKMLNFYIGDISFNEYRTIVLEIISKQ